MASGKSFVSMLTAGVFLTEILCFVAFPVKDYAEKNDTKPEVKFFECHAMACLIGYQFCDSFWKRCDDCLFYEKDCFTYRQQPNCTFFCQEKWLVKQKEILKNDECKTVEGQNAALLWIVVTAVLAILLLACGCVLFRDQVKSSLRWLGLEIPKQSGNYEAPKKQVNVNATETETFLVQNKRSKEEQQPTDTNKTSKDAYQTLDPTSIYSDRSNKKNTPFPRPETDSED